jgi:hypothetical protein
MAALSCNDLIFDHLDPRIFKTRLKIKKYWHWFIQISAGKSHRRAIKDFWKAPKTAVGCILHKSLTMTFGCTDLNETNANIFYFESSLHIFGSR